MPVDEQENKSLSGRRNQECGSGPSTTSGSDIKIFKTPGDSRKKI